MRGTFAPNDSVNYSMLVNSGTYCVLPLSAIPDIEPYLNICESPPSGPMTDWDLAMRTVCSKH